MWPFTEHDSDSDIKQAPQNNKNIIIIITSGSHLELTCPLAKE